MGLKITFDKIGKTGRAVRTITKNGKPLNVPINFEVITAKTEKDFEKDVEKVKRFLRRNLK